MRGARTKLSVPALTTWLLIAGQIGAPIVTAVHFAVTEHRYCFRHERIEELAEVSATDESEAPIAAHGIPSNAITASNDTSAQGYGNHAGCGFLALFQQRARFTLERVNHGLPAAVPSDPPPPLELPIPSAVVYRLAPKHSPPTT